MPDPTYQPKVYRKQGGNEFVVAAGGKITIETGGILAPSGGQAVAIPNVTGGATVDAEGRSAINAVLAALRGAGIIAAS